FNRDQGNAVEVASRAYARQGATGYLAGIMTAPWESMMHAASEVSEAANQLEESADRIGARCLGIQFEGPFLNPKFRRVHRSEWLLPATIERANEMIEPCRGAPGCARDGHHGAGSRGGRKCGAHVLRSRHRVFGRPHLSALSGRNAGDWSR